MEYLDVVDIYGTPTGEIVERSVAHAQGIMHRTGHVWITRVQNGKRQVLLQRRSSGKESYPLCYDTSSAGHVPVGEVPLDSAIRELREELGITAKKEDLLFCGTFHVLAENVFHGKAFHDNEIPFVFVYTKNVNADRLTLQKEEVDSVQWFDLDYILERSLAHDALFCVSADSLLLLQKQLEGT